MARRAVINSCEMRWPTTGGPVIYGRESLLGDQAWSSVFRRVVGLYRRSVDAIN